MPMGIQHRLEQLREEYAKGQQVLADLQRQQTDVQETLIRISGAIQVLEELIADEKPESEDQTTPAKNESDR